MQRAAQRPINTIPKISKNWVWTTPKNHNFAQTNHKPLFWFRYILESIVLQTFGINIASQTQRRTLNNFTPDTNFCLVGYYVLAATNLDLGPHNNNNRVNKLAQNQHMQTTDKQ